MFMMLKTMLETLTQDRVRTVHQDAAAIAPTKMLLKSLQTILSHEDLDQATVEQHLSRARLALDALPLSTVEYSQAAAALENAYGYFETGIPRAARYELRILLRSLRNNVA